MKIERFFEDTNVIYKDSLYSKIFNQYKLNFKEIPCSFYYIKSNESNGEYFAKLNQNCINDEIGYCSFFDEREDLLILNYDTIKLHSKLDPLTMRMYSLVLISGKTYSIFTAKSQSASGTGSQITFYVVVELSNNRKVEGLYEVKSRFGSINNIIDYNGDGQLDIITINNGKSQDEYNLTIKNLKNNQHSFSDSILLKYLGDEQFTILKSTIPLAL